MSKLDTSKLEETMRAFLDAHNEDECEFCKIIGELQSSDFVKDTLEGCLRMYPLIGLRKTFFSLFFFGLVAGVKLERARQLEEIFNETTE